MHSQWFIHSGGNTGQQGIEADWCRIFVTQQFVSRAVYSAMSHYALTKCMRFLLHHFFSAGQLIEMWKKKKTSRSHKHTKSLCSIVAHRQILPLGEPLQWTLNKESCIDLPAGGEVKESPLLLQKHTFLCVSLPYGPCSPQPAPTHSLGVQSDPSAGSVDKHQERAPHCLIQFRFQGLLFNEKCISLTVHNMKCM